MEYELIAYFSFLLITLALVGINVTNKQKKIFVMIIAIMILIVSVISVITYYDHIEIDCTIEADLYRFNDDYIVYITKIEPDSIRLGGSTYIIKSENGDVLLNGSIIHCIEKNPEFLDENFNPPDLKIRFLHYQCNNVMDNNEIFHISNDNNSNNFRNATFSLYRNTYYTNGDIKEDHLLTIVLDDEAPEWKNESRLEYISPYFFIFNETANKNSNLEIITEHIAIDANYQYYFVPFNIGLTLSNNDSKSIDDISITISWQFMGHNRPEEITSRNDITIENKSMRRVLLACSIDEYDRSGKIEIIVEVETGDGTSHIFAKTYMFIT